MKETFEEVAERLFNDYSSNTQLAEGYYDYTMEREDFKEAAIELIKWYEKNSWKLVSDETPPANIQLLAENPRGVVHLSSWRSSYHIFACQGKNESSESWKWKTI